MCRKTLLIEFIWKIHNGCLRTPQNVLCCWCSFEFTRKLLLSSVTRILQVFSFSLSSREETLLLERELFASRELIEKLMKNSQIIGKLKINQHNYLRAFKFLKVFLFPQLFSFHLDEVNRSTEWLYSFICCWFKLMLRERSTTMVVITSNGVRSVSIMVDFIRFFIIRSNHPLLFDLSIVFFSHSDFRFFCSFLGFWIKLLF